ncbi:MAG: phosphate ABC transporter substrate-binding protein PstS [Thermoleophilia bacterium]
MQTTRFSKRLALAAVIIVVVGLVAIAAGCGGSDTGATTGGTGPALNVPTANLTGAGATFPFPIYSKWFDVFSKQYPQATINYQSVGSGAGIQQIIAQTVDFGASDAPMKDDQLAKAPAELLHIPTVAGAVVITYNVDGVPANLKMTPENLANIFMGKLTKWNDPALKADNPGINFPDEDIVVVHRSDGSGTTNIFTSYLSAVSPDWNSQVGKGTDVKWPVGLGGKGNEGVSGQVSQTKGAIGYVELAYAKQNKRPYALMKNKAGNFVEATVASTTAAVQGAIANIPADFRIALGNPDGKDSYPIAGFTYLLVYKDQKDHDKGQVLVDFIWWALHDGSQYTAALDYVSQPPEMLKKVEDQVRKINYNGQSLAPQ